MLVLVAGCGAPDLADDIGPLVSLEDWEALGPEDDPLPAHRPAVDDCAPGGWFIEDGRLEVETGICHYLTLAQPTLRPVEAGSPIGVLAWHQGLDAAEPAEAHVALFLDDRLLWEAFAPIPADATVWETEVPAPADAPEGSSLVLHLHNHGFNTWALAMPERLE